MNRFCLQRAGPLPWKPPRWTTMFLLWPRQTKLDKPNTGSRQGLSWVLLTLWFLLHARKGRVRWVVCSWLQSVTSLPDTTKSYTRVLLVTFQKVKPIKTNFGKMVQKIILLQFYFAIFLSYFFNAAYLWPVMQPPPLCWQPVSFDMYLTGWPHWVLFVPFDIVSS